MLIQRMLASVAKICVPKASMAVVGRAQPVNHVTRTPHGQALAQLAPYQIPLSARATLGTLALERRVSQIVEGIVVPTFD